MEKSDTKKRQHKKIHHQVKPEINYEPQKLAKSFHFSKKNALELISATLITLLVLFLGLFYIAKNKTTAEILIDEFVDALKSKLGFEYSSDPLADFVFSQVTPNYNAFAADKKQAGTHRLMLERDGAKVEIKFQSAELYPKISDSTKSVSSAGQTDATDSAGTNPLEQTLDNINAQIDEIGSSLQNISKKITEIQQDISEISSKGKMVAEDGERKVLFQDIVYGTDLDYMLSEGGIQQQIILKNRENLNNRFNFSLNHRDLSYEDVGEGVWYFSNKENKVMRIPKAYAIDADGKFTNDVDIRVKTTLLVTIMTVVVPKEWLEEAGRAYPVKIHTAFEIVPNLRDGKAKPIEIVTPGITNTSVIPSITGSEKILPSTVEILPTETATISPTPEPSGFPNYQEP